MDIQKETTPMRSLTVDMGGTEYVMEAGGGCQPGPESVGSEELKDGAVEMVDLNQEVKDQMLTDSDRVTAEDLEGFEV